MLMEEVLAFLFRKAREEKMILVLDEYPYVRDVVAGLDSILQSLIDSEKDTSFLKLILCGSSIEVMKSLLDVGNPLYGQVDVTIHLKAMDYYDSALFYPTFSDEDNVRLYRVFGGIPYYNRLIDPTRSVTENIIGLVTAPDARLENEGGMYLKSQRSPTPTKCLRRWRKGFPDSATFFPSLMCPVGRRWLMSWIN